LDCQHPALRYIPGIECILRTCRSDRSSNSDNDNEQPHNRTSHKPRQASQRGPTKLNACHSFRTGSTADDLTHATAGSGCYSRRHLQILRRQDGCRHGLFVDGTCRGRDRYMLVVMIVRGIEKKGTAGRLQLQILVHLKHDQSKLTWTARQRLTRHLKNWLFLWILWKRRKATDAFVSSTAVSKTFL
jgi:hypothetical protein